MSVISYQFSVISSAPKSSAKSFVFSTAFQQGSPTFHALRMSQSDMTTQLSAISSELGRQKEVQLAGILTVD